MVVETDWPAVCSGVTMSETSVAISAAGQSAWVAGIRTALQGLSGGRGVGIVYWEPGWIGNAGLGSSCSVRTFVQVVFVVTETKSFIRMLYWLMDPVILVRASVCSPPACKAPHRRAFPYLSNLRDVLLHRDYSKLPHDVIHILAPFKSITLTTGSILSFTPSQLDFFYSTIPHQPNFVQCL